MGFETKSPLKQYFKPLKFNILFEKYANERPADGIIKAFIFRLDLRQNSSIKQNKQIAYIFLEKNFELTK